MVASCGPAPTVTRRSVPAGSVTIDASADCWFDTTRYPLGTTCAPREEPPRTRGTATARRQRVVGIGSSYGGANGSAKLTCGARRVPCTALLPAPAMGGIVLAFVQAGTMAQTKLQTVAQTSRR